MYAGGVWNASRDILLVFFTPTFFLLHCLEHYKALFDQLAS